MDAQGGFWHRNLSGGVSSGASVPSPSLSSSSRSPSKQPLSQGIGCHSASSSAHPFTSARTVSPRAGPGQLRVPKTAANQPCAHSTRDCTGTAGDHGAALGISKHKACAWCQSNTSQPEKQIMHQPLLRLQALVNPELSCTAPGANVELAAFQSNSCSSSCDSACPSLSGNTFYGLPEKKCKPRSGISQCRWHS